MGDLEGGGLRRQQVYTELLEALRDDEGTHGMYAACEIIEPSQQGFIMESLHVEGVGKLHLPLSVEDTCKLRGVCEQAPFGQGFSTVVDTTVRRCWQVDASRVTFPGAPEFMSKTIQQLAMEAVHALGLNGEAMELEAHFYKLLLYEEDGHFKIHRDTEKEKGMFATLLLQLPTEEGFQGGELMVKHKNSSKTFDCSISSSTRFRYTVFFADCEHELKRITSGTRLCLAFNLVRRNTSSEEVQHLKDFFLKVGEVEGALQPWLDEVMEGEFNTFGLKLAFPLEHKYTRENLSFAGLKGEDKIMAEVLKNCRDDDNVPLLDLHLCLVTKHQEGEPEPDYGYHDDSSPDKSWYGPPDESSDDSDDDSDDQDDHASYHTMNMDTVEEDIGFTNWIGIDDEASEVFRYLSIDMDYEVVVDEGEDVFYDDPDDEDYEGYTGNAGSTMDYWYHRAMLVVWPKELSISVACEAGIAKALDLLEPTAEIEEPRFGASLDEILCYCEENGSEVSDTSRLLNLFSRVGGSEDVLRVLKLLPQAFQVNRYGMTIGNMEVGFVSGIAAVVQKFGWELCSSLIIDLVKESALSQGELFAQLGKELFRMGNKDAAIIVAEKTFDVLWTTNSTISNLDEASLCTVVKILFSLEEIHNNFGPKLVERLKEIKTGVLIPLVIQIHPRYASVNWKLYPACKNTDDETSSSMPKKEVLSALELFFQISQTLVSRDFHKPTSSQAASRFGARHDKPIERQIVDLVRFFFSLGNKMLFDKLIENLVNQARSYKQYHLLKTLLHSELIWKELSSEPFGTAGLQSLANALIGEVSSHKEPVFTWCQPLAKLSDHPAVQRFLRGPKESMIYSGLSGLPQARKFARNFNGTYRCGYSAIGKEGGRGAGAFCEIQKSRHAFEAAKEPWKKEQEELKVLRTRLASLRSPITQPDVATVNSSLNEVGQHAKKRKL